MESLHFRRGFTLIELLVVLAIITVVMAVVLTGQSTFNKTLILQNTAYDIALTLRDAETYGLGSRAIGQTANTGYGVHLQAGTPGSFLLFADTWPAASCSTPDCKPGDGMYTPQDMLVQTYTLGNGITISDFCAQKNGTWSCAATHGGGLSSLDIVFARPNPDVSLLDGNGLSYSSVCLSLSSPQGGSRFISVASSGEITASAASCP